MRLSGSGLEVNMSVWSYAPKPAGRNFATKGSGLGLLSKVLEASPDCRSSDVDEGASLTPLRLSMPMMDT